MRIAYVINSCAAGGAERHLLALARWMQKRGHEVMVITLRSADELGNRRGGALSLAPAFFEAGIPVVRLRTFGCGEAGRWAHLAYHLKKYRPMLVHSHLPRADIAAIIALHLSGLRERTRWLTTLHDAYAKGVYAGHWIFPLAGRLWRMADGLAAVSGHARDWALRALGVAPDRLHVLYHGVPMITTATDSDEQKRAESVIGCLARYEPRKGAETLVRAMPYLRKQHPAARLRLAGSDPDGYRQHILDLVKELKLEDCVEVGGFCDDPAGFLKDIDIFSLASVAEGFGLVVLEAMAAGRPVVVSDIYPLNYIVEPGVSGLVARVSSPELFAAAFARLLGDPGLAQTLCQGARQRCQDRFSEDSAFGRVEALYSTMTGAKIGTGQSA